MDFPLLVPISEYAEFLWNRLEREERSIDPEEARLLEPPHRQQRRDVLLDQQRAMSAGTSEARIEELAREERTLVLGNDEVRPFEFTSLRLVDGDCVCELEVFLDGFLGHPLAIRFLSEIRTIA